MAAAEELVDTITNYFHANHAHAVKNDSLYAPLTQQDHHHHGSATYGIGVNLMLVHDPPLGSGAPPAGVSVSGTYINIVESVEKNTPASKVFRAGDIILQVNDAIMDYGRQLYLPEDVANMIRGPEGSQVMVVVDRDGEEMEFVLRRERLPSDVLIKAVVPVTPEQVEHKKIREGGVGDLFMSEDCPIFPCNGPMKKSSTKK